MKNFRDKRCFITGAASGIGRATALALASEGAALALTDINAEALADTAQQAQALGARILGERQRGDRKSIRLNSSHVRISYAVFCLKKKKKKQKNTRNYKTT